MILYRVFQWNCQLLDRVLQWFLSLHGVSFTIGAMILYILAFVYFTIDTSQSTVSFNCRDESGKSVDWFIVYKIPKLEDSSNPIIKSGYAYAYITNNTAEDSDWDMSEKRITDKDSIYGQTLVPLYQSFAKDENTFSFVLYNDQSPKSKSSSSLAHAKGVIAIGNKDNNNGFWLLHSVPRFPPLLNESYSYPNSGSFNGQSSICITLSMDAKNLENLATQLLYMKPAVYQSTITNDLINKSPQWIQLQKKKWIRQSPYFSHLSIKSKSGLSFESFVKSDKYNDDLYANLVAPNLGVDLLVQSWRNGKGDPLDSNCSVKYKVENVDKVRLFFGKKTPNDEDWSYSEDHSKWGVADDRNKLFTCIGDINRMKSQFKRGGGTICSKIVGVWNSFRKSVEGIEGCKIKPKNKKTLQKRNVTDVQYDNHKDDNDDDDNDNDNDNDIK